MNAQQASPVLDHGLDRRTGLDATPATIIGATFGSWLILLLSRLVPAVPALEGTFISVDEIELTLTTLDRILGLPTTSLAWPGTLVQTIALPFHVALLLVTSLLPDADGLASVVGATYRDPAAAVFLERVVSLAVFTTAAAAWVPYLIRRGVSPLTASSVVVLGALQPLVWFHSFVGTGESVAMGCVLLAMRVAATETPAALPRAAFILGLALSARLTLAPCWVLLLCLGKRPRAGVLVLWSVLGFVVGCPHVWLEPVRLAKSVIGNLIRPAGGSSDPGLVLLLRAVPVATWLMALGLAIATFREGWRRALHDPVGKVCVATAGLILLALLLVNSGRQVELRYLLFLPVTFWALALWWLRDRSLGGSMLPRQRLWLAVTVCLLVSLQTPQFVQLAAHRSRYLRATSELSAALDATHRWLLDARLLAAAMPHLTAAQLDAVRTALQTRYLQADAKAGFATTRGLPAKLATLLASNFTEDEQAQLSRLRAAATVEPKHPVPVTLFGDVMGSTMDLTGAVSALEQGGADRLVVMDSPVDGVPIIETFGTQEEGRVFVHGWR